MLFHVVLCGDDLSASPRKLLGGDNRITELDWTINIMIIVKKLIRERTNVKSQILITCAYIVF